MPVGLESAKLSAGARAVSRWSTATRAAARRDSGKFCFCAQIWDSASRHGAQRPFNQSRPGKVNVGHLLSVYGVCVRCAVLQVREKRLPFVYYAPGRSRERQPNREESFPQPAMSESSGTDSSKFSSACRT